MRCLSCTYLVEWAPLVECKGGQSSQSDRTQARCESAGIQAEAGPVVKVLKSVIYISTRQCGEARHQSGSEGTSALSNRPGTTNSLVSDPRGMRSDGRFPEYPAERGS